MFLLNNIHDRPYRQLYSKPNILFDISQSQLGSAKNADWEKIAPNSIVCVVNSSRKISAFCVVSSREPIELPGDPDQNFALLGSVVARLATDIDMATLLNRFGVQHPYLPGNKFSIGFNVADLGSALDELVLQRKSDARTTLGELKALRT